MSEAPLYLAHKKPPPRTATGSWAQAFRRILGEASPVMFFGKGTHRKGHASLLLLLALLSPPLIPPLFRL